MPQNTSQEQALEDLSQGVEVDFKMFRNPGCWRQFFLLVVATIVLLVIIFILFFLA